MSVVNVSEKQRHSAVHEAGHAVVAARLGFAVQRVSLLPEGFILGIIETDAARIDLPFEQLEDAVAVALAGNLAEEILLGSIMSVSGISRERESDEQHVQILFSILCPWSSSEIRSRCQDRARALIASNSGEIAALAANLLAGKVVTDYSTPA